MSTANTLSTVTGPVAVARTVKTVIPVPVGVPDSRPDELRLNPPGAEPDVTDHEHPLQPGDKSCCEYAVPTVPAGSAPSLVMANASRLNVTELVSECDAESLIVMFTPPEPD